jgi:hypothetical protein
MDNAASPHAMSLLTLLCGVSMINDVSLVLRCLPRTHLSSHGHADTAVTHPAPHPRVLAPPSRHPWALTLSPQMSPQATRAAAASPFTPPSPPPGKPAWRLRPLALGGARWSSLVRMQALDHVFVGSTPTPHECERGVNAQASDAVALVLVRVVSSVRMHDCMCKSREPHRLCDLR